MSSERDPLWDALKEMSKDNKARRIEKNLSALDKFINALNEKGIEFREAGYSLLFREPGKPKVDYYYSKGNWRVNDKKYRGGFLMMYGGWKNFLKWYEKQAWPQQFLKTLTIKRMIWKRKN